MPKLTVWVSRKFKTQDLTPGSFYEHIDRKNGSAMTVIAKSILKVRKTTDISMKLHLTYSLVEYKAGIFSSFAFGPKFSSITIASEAFNILFLWNKSTKG